MLPSVAHKASQIGITIMLSLLGLITTHGRASAGYVDVIALANPVGYWRFEEADTSQPVFNSGSLGAASAGTYGSATSLASSLPNLGQAVSFSGNTNSWVDIADVAGNLVFDGTAAFSFEAWIKTPGSADYARLADRGYTSGYGLAWNVILGGPGETSGYFIRRNAPLVSFGAATNLEDDAWHHVVSTYDGTAMRTYFDGALVGGPVAGGAMTVNNSELVNFLRLGGNPNGNERITGLMDEIAVYDYPLTTTQIGDHYNAGIAVVPEPGSGLVAAAVFMVGLTCRRLRTTTPRQQVG